MSRSRHLWSILISLSSNNFFVGWASLFDSLRLFLPPHMLLYLGNEFFFVAIPHLTCPDSYLSLAITSYFSNTSSALSFQPHELCLLSDPQYLPTWYPHPSSRPLFRRLRTVGDKLGAIMAAYQGYYSQLCLPKNLLRANQLYLSVLKHHVRDSARNFHLRIAARRRQTVLVPLQISIPTFRLDPSIFGWSHVWTVPNFDTSLPVL